MRRVLVVGNGGRESALAAGLSQSSAVCAFMGHRNPTILAAAVEHELGDVCDPEAVARFARRAGVDVAIVSADEPLAAGVVDALSEAGIPTAGPTRAGAQIEWDKTMARELIAEAYPSANPAHRVVRDPAELDAAFAALGDMPLAIKPAGLTGGKGVKVMGPHLESHADAHRYAEELLRSGPHPRAVVLEERVDALEFTIQAITDGTSCAFPPATFDYPYRFDGDSGPGTGGMGCYTSGAGPLPFMTQADYDEACEIIHAILARWKDRGRPFSGVLNTGFFLTDTGLKVIETNARFGDPEAMNIAALLQTDMTAVVAAVAAGRLNELAVEFNDQISVVTYLVTPGYPQPGAGGLEFDFDVAAATRHGCVLHCAACEQIATNRYRTVGASRVMALAALGSHLDDTHARVQQAIRDSFAGEPALQWRTDIGSPAYVERQRDVVAHRVAAPLDG